LSRAGNIVVSILNAIVGLGTVFDGLAHFSVWFGRNGKIVLAAGTGQSSVVSDGLQTP
jgi:hypothetical protein